MLENSLALRLEESSDFFSTSKLFKQISVLKSSSMLRVIAHQVLSQEDAWVESLSDAWINFICIQRDSLITMIECTYLDPLC